MIQPANVMTSTTASFDLAELFDFLAEWDIISLSEAAANLVVQLRRQKVRVGLCPSRSGRATPPFEKALDSFFIPDLALRRAALFGHGTVCVCVCVINNSDHLRSKNSPVVLPHRGPKYHTSFYSL